MQSDWADRYAGMAAAMGLIRRHIEAVAPGTLPACDPLDPPPPNREAEAICRAIDRLTSTAGHTAPDVVDDSRVSR